MKTLKDEIVAALRKSVEIIYELETKPNIKHRGLELFRENTVNLAAKVESARCENCESFYNQDHECFYTKTKEGVGCWHFEPKEK